MRAGVLLPLPTPCDATVCCCCPIITRMPLPATPPIAFCCCCDTRFAPGGTELLLTSWRKDRACVCAPATVPFPTSLVVVVLEMWTCACGGPSAIPLSCCIGVTPLDCIRLLQR
uniref:Putative secreted protein n=1 Tax=Anopheles marajoara TaxID=58244 RepID=A0A2M4C804_9DIPT